MSEWELLYACYLSGQISEMQWTAHLADPEFAAWVARKDKAAGK